MAGWGERSSELRKDERLRGKLGLWVAGRLAGLRHGHTKAAAFTALETRPWSTNLLEQHSISLPLLSLFSLLPRDTERVLSLMLSLGKRKQMTLPQPDQWREKRDGREQSNQEQRLGGRLWHFGSRPLPRTGAGPRRPFAPPALERLTPRHPPAPAEQRATLGRGVVVRVGVALAAVLHQEGGVVPGHAEDAIGLVQQDVGQHPAVAVHDDHLPIGRAEQHLLVIGSPYATRDLTFQVDLR